MSFVELQLHEREGTKRPGTNLRSIGDDQITTSERLVVQIDESFESVLRKRRGEKGREGRRRGELGRLAVPLPSSSPSCPTFDPAPLPSREEEIAHLLGSKLHERVPSWFPLHDACLVEEEVELCYLSVL